MLLRILTGLSLSAVLYAQTDTPDYRGPSILSRGLLPSVNARETDIRFRPFISVAGICDTGLTALAVNSNGKLPNVAACGVSLSAGLYGYHRWKRTTLGVNYSGDYQHYPRATYYDGTDQMLSLGLTNQMSRSVSLTLRAQAGTYTRNYFNQATLGIVDTTTLQSPNALLFDNRVSFGTATADLTFRRGVRWSFNVGGLGYLTRYRSAALYGATTSGVHADLAYRYSRNGTIGAAYGFSHYSFTKSFGTSDGHLMALLYALRLSRTWEFAAQAGVTRLESLTRALVTLDPVIALITGQSVAVIAAYRLNYEPTFNFSLSKGFRTGSLSFVAGRSVTPGDGVYLSSVQDVASVAYTYSALRYWHFNAGAGYTRLVGLIQTLGAYSGYTGGVGVTRSLGKSLSAALRIEARHYGNGTALVRRNPGSASLGISWSPGDVPLSLW